MIVGLVAQNLWKISHFATCIFCVCSELYCDNVPPDQQGEMDGLSPIQVRSANSFHRQVPWLLAKTFSVTVTADQAQMTHEYIFLSVSYPRCTEQTKTATESTMFCWKPQREKKASSVSFSFCPWNWGKLRDEQWPTPPAAITHFLLSLFLLISS